MKRMASILLLILAGGCGSMSMPSLGDLWPFGGEAKRTDIDRRPRNATEYVCSGKAFYVRPLDDGAVWLIVPDREIRLARLGPNRYGAGRVVLELQGDEATLSDPPSSFVGCRKGKG